MKEFIEEAERFVLLDNKEEIGEITWKNHDGYLLVYHTGVNPDYRGQGLAGQLLEQVVAKVRKENLKIYPTCPFVVREFMMNPEQYEDIWQKVR